MIPPRVVLSEIRLFKGQSMHSTHACTQNRYWTPLIRSLEAGSARILSRICWCFLHFQFPVRTVTLYLNCALMCINSNLKDQKHNHQSTLQRKERVTICNTIQTFASTAMDHIVIILPPWANVFFDSFCTRTRPSLRKKKRWRPRLNSSIRTSQKRQDCHLELQYLNETSIPQRMCPLLDWLESSSCSKELHVTRGNDSHPIRAKEASKFYI